MEEFQFRYKLVPAVLICCVCGKRIDKRIERGEPFDKVVTI
jgi:hypothetical protein